MAFPESLADFRALCAAMRECDAVQAFGVVLGPETPRVKKLEAAAENDPQAASELRAARREERIEAARNAVRDRLGRYVPDSVADQYVDPQVFES